jgi:outer membrane biosynthesis protein TonB
MNLIDYIQGKRRGKEANRLEREAINDPFLQDAIDGFDAVPGDHLSAIHDLEAQLQQQLSKKKRVISYRWLTIGVAATIALIVGIGSLMHVDVKAPARVATRTVKPRVITPPSAESIPQPAPKTIARHIYKPTPKPVAPANVPLKEGALNLEMTNSDVIMDTMVYTAVTPSSQVSAFRPIGAKATVTQAPTVTPALNPITGKVRGVVLDESGEPLIGASVRLNGSDAATVTGADGKFELPARGANSGLMVRYIGYEKADVPALSDSNIIRLKPSNLTLNEVVTVKYGSNKGKELSVSKVDEALQGRMAGLDIVGRSKKMKPRNISFGEKEFKVYFEHYRTKHICDDKGGTVKATFTIDAAGKPTGLTITKSTCEALSTELTRLLKDSPTWTDTGQKVDLKIVLK